jgi:putative tryptophan/tyrosine transport system substrate-binding protein
LRELGYVNGQTIGVYYYHLDGLSDRFPALAAECLRLKPDIIVVTTTPPVKLPRTQLTRSRS